MPPDPTDEMEGAPGEAGHAEQARPDEPVDVEPHKIGLPVQVDVRDDRPFDEEFHSEGTQTLALDDEAIEMLDAGAAPAVPLRASTVISAAPPPPPPPPQAVQAHAAHARAVTMPPPPPPAAAPQLEDDATNEFEANPRTQALSVDDLEILTQEAAPKVEAAPAPPREPTVVDRAADEARADAWDKRVAELLD